MAENKNAQQVREITDKLEQVSLMFPRRTARSFRTLSSMS